MQRLGVPVALLGVLCAFGRGVASARASGPGPLPAPGRVAPAKDARTESQEGDADLGLDRGLGLGRPVSEWYFSLKTSKGYCGLVAATPAAGGYGLAIACANKYPQYDSHFTLLLPDAAAAAAGAQHAPHGTATYGTAQQGAGTDDAAEAGAAGAAEAGGAGREAHRGLSAAAAASLAVLGGDTGGRAELPGGPSRRLAAAAGGGGGAGTGGERASPLVLSRRPHSGSGAEEAEGAGADVEAGEAEVEAEGGGMEGRPGVDPRLLRFRDVSGPILVTAGQPLRLLSRAAGLCGTPPPTAAPPPAGKAAFSAADSTAATPGAGGAEVGAATATMSGVHGPSGPLHGCLLAWLRAAGAWFRAAWHRLLAAAGLLPNRPAGGLGAGASPGRLSDIAPWPVTCVLAQPTLSVFKIQKADLKDGETLDLNKDWFYLMEGDKYCTTTDVAGMSTVVSCHLDNPGWYGYKFQLQIMSYPRATVGSVLTGGPCGLKPQQQPPPHDMQCKPSAQAGRDPTLDLVLMAPGTPLTAGVIVGFSSFAPGLVGAELQRCCGPPSSPHIMACEPPPPPAATVAPECWFQLYDVKVDLAAVVRDRERERELEGGSGPGQGQGEGGGYGEGDGDGGGEGGGMWARFLRALQGEMSPVDLDPDLGSPTARSGAGPLREEGERGAATNDAPILGHGKADVGAETAPNEEVETQAEAATLRSDPGAEEEAEEEPYEDLDGGGGWLGLRLGLALGRMRSQLRWPFDAAAPLGDGSLVMLYSRQYSRYCSVSLDGSLLCVSVAASNASRNLFQLTMPPLPDGLARAEGGAGPLFEDRATVDLNEPVPRWLFTPHWTEPNSTRALNRRQRAQLVCLTAASDDVPNLEVALAAAGPAPQQEHLDAAASAGALDACRWLAAPGRIERGVSWPQVLSAAAQGGQRGVCA
ncbi:hypothetical protein HYH03_001571 [Edaphochlamys debaryana]|uniref:Uncharacterized protein n=1 Tax=Edaphochlamys debaryana TaxID=47281 RepID=A0A835YN80_9CHLO|nr:hypothetical protein HYH03_001571 [Edaphochlamys debaryana]|eukprot:KAG2500809.1 hypothetical protein HYH03_001571 [Edaphochlamys debaryana]